MKTKTTYTLILVLILNISTMVAQSPSEIVLPKSDDHTSSQSIPMVPKTRRVSQNVFFIGSKSYPCTMSMRFQVGDNYSNQAINCIVAKNGNNGFFVISKETAGSIIKGNATLYLDDGSVITLIDRGKRDYVDNTSTTIYNLTSTEIEKLKNSTINTVRFTIKCFQSGCYSFEDGNFTGKNVLDGNSTGKFANAKLGTDGIIKALFNEF